MAKTFKLKLKRCGGSYDIFDRFGLFVGSFPTSRYEVTFGDPKLIDGQECDILIKINRKKRRTKWQKRK